MRTINGTLYSKRASRLKMIALKMKKARGKRTSVVGWLATEERHVTNAILPLVTGIGRVNNASPHMKSLEKLRMQEKWQLAKQLVASGLIYIRGAIILCSSAITEANRSRIVRLFKETIGSMRHAWID